MENQILVIFGSNGNLAKRKIFPALFQLHLDRLLPERYMVIGTGSHDKETDEFRDYVKSCLQQFGYEVDDNNPETKNFLSYIHYKRVLNQTEEDFKLLKNFIDKQSREYHIPPNIIFYFAIPPFLYDVAAGSMIKYGLSNEDDGWKRIIMEKPFGYSYDTAADLEKKLHRGFHEHQIYRIDHYLGKETVQNIMIARFANGIFEPVWNNRYIERVEITVAESIGVEKRGMYYDMAGAMRDMVQNHLLHLLAIAAMEPPVVFDSDSIRNEIVKVLESLRPIKANEVTDYVVRGQYIESDKNKKDSYRMEKGVAPDSNTDTFAAMKLFIDNWRWANVPFYIRTGKRMPERLTEVVLYLKPSPYAYFKHRSFSESANRIILRLNPLAGVAIDLGMKAPGAGYKVQNVEIAYHYEGKSASTVCEAYERLILDCMTGDSTLFTRADAVLAGWKFVDPVLKIWEENENIPLYFYASGTWGPEEADSLFGDDTLKWHEPLLQTQTGSDCAVDT